jgi:PAS domain S-box-containing protein
MERFASEASRSLENTLLYEYLRYDRDIISAEKNKLSTILAGINDSVIAVDRKHTIITFNLAAEKLTGYKAKDVIGKPLNTTIKIYSKTQEIPVSKYCPILSTEFEGVTYSGSELRIRGANNKEAIVNMIVGQIKEGVQMGLGGIISLQDITEKQRLEAMKLDFVSLAAHELRTPLTSVRGYLSVFIEETKNVLKQEQHELLKRMQMSTGRLNELVENLLNVARIERGVFTLNPKPIDWVANVEQLMDDFHELSKIKQITLTFIPPKEPIPPLVIDKIRISEVFNNLVSNALNYTEPQGSVKVWIEQKGDEVITHVQDTGRGIPKEMQQFLFSKFFRVPSKIPQTSQGTGLGLYISKAMVEMHKGRIWVESEEGKGSTFSFAIPIYPQVIPPVLPPSQNSALVKELKSNS